MIKSLVGIRGFDTVKYLENYTVRDRMLATRHSGARRLCAAEWNTHERSRPITKNVH
jgi:hypothetical protein